MPKFIGTDIPGARELEQHNTDNVPGMVRLTAAQARIHKRSGKAVFKSLDTTDRGGPHSYAKRWYRWFAFISDVFEGPSSTTIMHRRARQALESQFLKAMQANALRKKIR